MKIEPIQKVPRKQLTNKLKVSDTLRNLILIQNIKYIG
jgi:hypothetical protein